MLHSAHGSEHQSTVITHPPPIYPSFILFLLSCALTHAQRRGERCLSRATALALNFWSRHSSVCKWCACLKRVASSLRSPSMLLSVAAAGSEMGGSELRKVVWAGRSGAGRALSWRVLSMYLRISPGAAPRVLSTTHHTQRLSVVLRRRLGPSPDSRAGGWSAGIA